MESSVRERAVVLFGALAHDTRLRIVELLVDGERTVNDVAATLGLQQTTASQHLRVLTNAGLLAVEQRRSSRYYRLRGPRVGRVMGLIEEFCQVHGLYGATGAPIGPSPASSEGERHSELSVAGRA